MMSAGLRLAMPAGKTVAFLLADALDRDQRRSALVFIGSADGLRPCYRYVPRRNWQHVTVHADHHVVLLLARPWKVALFEAASYWRWIAAALTVAIATAVL